MVQMSEPCSAVGLGLGLGVGLGVGVGVAVGVAEGSEVGGVVPVLPVESTGVGVPLVAGVVSVGFVLGTIDELGVGTGVAPAARSPTVSVTFGTSSSNTALLTVTSPDPVMSTEAVSKRFFKRIETCALAKVIPSTVL